MGNKLDLAFSGQVKKDIWQTDFIIGIVFSVLSFAAIVGTAILNSFFGSCRGRF